MRPVHALQDRFAVVPLRTYGHPYAPPPGNVDPNIDMKTAVRKQVNSLDIDTYFNRLAELMKTNPPTVADAPIVARMARIGLVPGQGASIRASLASWIARRSRSFPSWRCLKWD